MAPSHIQPSLLSTLETLDEPSDAPPAKGSMTAVATASVTVSSTISGSVNAGKALFKKAGGTSLHSSLSMMSKTSDRVKSGNVGGKHNALEHQVVLGNAMHGNLAQTSKQTGLLPGPPNIPVPIRVPVPLTVTSGSISTVTTSKTQAVRAAQIPVTSSGPVRQLFPQTTSNQTSTGISLLGPQPVYSPLIASPPAPSIPIISKASIQASKPSQQFTKSSAQNSGSSKHQSGRSRPSEGASTIQNLPPNASNSKDKHSAAPKNTQATMYSSVINTGATSSEPQAPSSGFNNVDVIEQPLQQIMKTPMLFQESAAQLTKPKKKSTYSDAVGKKNESSHVQGSKVNQVGAIGTHPCGPQPPPPQQHKLNLAPGTRPVGPSNVGDKVSEDFIMKRGNIHFLIKGVSVEKRVRTTIPWSEVSVTTAPGPIGGPSSSGGGGERSRPPSGDMLPPNMDPSPFQKQASFEEEQGKLSPVTTSLGPIGPPSR